MQTGSIIDDVSSDASPFITTPSSSSPSYDQSPNRSKRQSPNVRTSNNHIPSSIDTAAANSAAISTIASTTAPAADKRKETDRGRQRSVDRAKDEQLVDPSRYEQEEDDEFDAWNDDGLDGLDGGHGEDGDMDAEAALNGGAAGSRPSQPLLGKEDRGRPSYDSPSGSARPPFHARRSTFRSRSPDYQAAADTKKKYTYAAFFLGVSLVSFVIQTETAVYIQHDLGWNKAYSMLWLTHGSWSLLWPVTFLILRLQKKRVPFDAFWRRHKQLLRTTAQMVESQQTHLSPKAAQKSPIPYILRTTAFVTTALTVAGGSWYVAVDLTTASDLTAIYNCSAFFAYAFSIPLLGDKLRWSKVFSVGVAIIGVLVVAYGDVGAPKHGTKSGGSVPGNKDHETDANDAQHRLLGNIIIGIGSVLYGLYEVLYKKLACPPEGTTPGRGMIFAMTFGSLIGSFTVLVLWIPIPILHITGIEPFELPHGEAAWMLAISVLMNATFSGSFLVLISLTSPVLSSVAALLTIFLVAITDWLVTGQPLTIAAIMGGLLIIAAFLLLSWDSYKEMEEEKKRKREEADIVDDDEDDD